MPVEMQQMPAIWDDERLITSSNAVLGQLANWAIQQSPYLYPDNLAKALDEFSAVFGTTGELFPLIHASCKQLREAIREALDACPSIIAWNSPKDGSNPEIVICSRYDKPAPDQDIIDLDALARNMAHSITLAEKYDRAHDLNDEEGGSDAEG